MWAATKAVLQQYRGKLLGCQFDQLSVYVVSFVCLDHRADIWCFCLLSIVTLPSFYLVTSLRLTPVLVGSSPFLFPSCFCPVPD